MASLDRMISSSRRALEQRRGARPLAELEEAVGALDPIRPFTEAVVGEEISFVLRVRRRRPGAPGRGRRGRGGRAGGAAGDAAPAGFEETSLPVLHRGVLIDPYQLYESRLGGADGVVLIAEAFDDEDERVRRDADRGRPARPGRRRPGRRRGRGRARPRAARPGLVPDPEPARRQGRAPTSSTPSRCSRRCRPARSSLSQGGIRTATRCSRSRAPASTPRSSAGWVQRHGIAATLDVLRGDTRE